MQRELVRDATEHGGTAGKVTWVLLQLRHLSLARTKSTQIATNTEPEQHGTGRLQFRFRWKDKEQITCKNNRLEATEKR